MSPFLPDDGALANKVVHEVPPHSAVVPEQRMRAAAGLLLALSLAYALTATATLPHRLSLADAISVFLAGAIPGLLVTVLLWMAHPGLFGPALRRRVLGVSLSGAMGVALLTLVAPGL
jgi:hypothetical protein